MHAVLKPRLGPLLRERIPAIQRRDGESYYSAHCDYSLWFEGQKHCTVTVDYLGPSPLDCFELFEGQSRSSRLKKLHFSFYDSVLQWFLFSFAAFLAISQAERGDD